MAKSGLGFEELALVDQVGGDAVAQPVQGRGLDARCFAEPSNSVGQRTGGEVAGSGRIGGEQPVPDALA